MCWLRSLDPPKGSHQPTLRKDTGRSNWRDSKLPGWGWDFLLDSILQWKPSCRIPLRLLENMWLTINFNAQCDPHTSAADSRHLLGDPNLYAGTTPSHFLYSWLQLLATVLPFCFCLWNGEIKHFCSPEHFWILRRKRRCTCEAFNCRHNKLAKHQVTWSDSCCSLTSHSTSESFAICSPLPQESRPC